MSRKLERDIRPEIPITHAPIVSNPKMIILRLPSTLHPWRKPLSHELFMSHFKTF